MKMGSLKISNLSFKVAARQDHFEAVALLVKWGACINLKNSDGLSPLHFAAWASIKTANM
jgi:ankyrin repeat protein